MRTLQYLHHWLVEHAKGPHFLFTPNNLRPLFPDLSGPAWKTLLSRAAASGILTRLCRGIYLFKKSLPPDGLLLFHVAAFMRAHEFNYISLETALSDSGVISQMPINYISIMSSGRSNVIACGTFGTIEFVHTNRQPADLIHQLDYDHHCGLWRAHVVLALQDMKRTHRSCDLVD